MKNWVRPAEARAFQVLGTGASGSQKLQLSATQTLIDRSPQIDFIDPEARFQIVIDPGM